MAERSPKVHILKTMNLAAGFSMTNVIKTEPYIDVALKLLKIRVDEVISQNKPVKWEEWLNYLAFDVLREATFSRSFGLLESGADIGDTIANEVYIRVYISILGHFPSAHKWLLANPLIEYFNMTLSMHIFDTCLAAIESRSENPEVRKDTVEQLKDQLKKCPDRMEEREIVTAAVGNLGAGGDAVSSVLLQAFVYHMIHGPDMLNMLRKELDGAGLAEVPT